ncbi:uncharacterized protein LOC130676568 [Microplitis mediator]|uniref:uncharacterized protein LOC130676568 n=1 Tax=Microplitis mediator TaxID=375433 RepID=UPI002552E2FB|nr:uncharacterized protein LOC130676568 [Microplitis mediator]
MSNIKIEILEDAEDSFRVVTSGKIIATNYYTEILGNFLDNYSFFSSRPSIQMSSIRMKAASDGPDVAPTITTSVLEVIDSKILSVERIPVVIKTQDLVNSSSVSATFSTSLEKEIDNAAMSSWTNFEAIPLVQSQIGAFCIKIKYNDFLLDYSQCWGEIRKHNKTVTLRDITATEVTLQPGQGVTVKLTALKTIVKAEILYCWSNYNTIKNFTEIIQTEFYRNSQVLVEDK